MDRRELKDYCVKSKLLKQLRASPHVRVLISAVIPVARQRGGAGALGLFRDKPTIQNASKLFFPEASETEACWQPRGSEWRGIGRRARPLEVCSCCSCSGCLMSVPSRRGFVICGFSCSVMSNCACCARCDCCLPMHERVYIHCDTEYFFYFFFCCLHCACVRLCVHVCLPWRVCAPRLCEPLCVLIASSGFSVLIPTGISWKASSPLSVLILIANAPSVLVIKWKIAH